MRKIEEQEAEEAIKEYDGKETNTVPESRIGLPSGETTYL
jgi:hypothetical protein